MDKAHLNDFLDIHEENPSVIVGDIISEYTSLAIGFSKDPMKVSSQSYDLAYKIIMEKYKTK